MTDDEIDARIDQLFSLVPQEFIGARKRLLADITAAKRLDAKAKVLALRRPTVAAWVVNQLRRRVSRDLDVLFNAGDELRRAQRSLLGPDGKAAMSAALAREREAIDRMLAEARGLLQVHGFSPSASTLEGVTNTLRTLARATDARAEFHGRLEQELDPPGLEVLMAEAPSFEEDGPAAGDPGKKSLDSTAPDPSAVRGDVAREAADEAGEARQRVEAERRLFEERRIRAEHRRKLENDRDERRAEVERRRTAATEATTRQQEAERVLRDARTTVERAERALAGARRAAEEAASVVERTTRSALAAAADLRSAQAALEQAEVALRASTG